MKPSILQINNVTKVYPSTPTPIQALQGISLEVQQGEILGLLGVNGAGKSTLSSLLATLHPPTSGTITWQGRSIYENLLTYRSSMGFCPQRQNFDTLLTVRQNLIFAGRYFLMAENEITRRVDALMEQFDLGRYAHASVSMLSGGYRQRLLIARALVHTPSLVILDEPTIALDPHVRRQLWNRIIGLKEEGVTIIFTTHYLDEAEVLSDRVCIMDKGLIRLIDKPKNLMTAYNKTRLEDVFLQLTQETKSAKEG
jgi:ABC-2 type transport system ATP-binding protein